MAWKRGCGDGPEGVQGLVAGRRIAWVIRQAQGTATPHETIGQMAARGGVAPRWVRKLLQRWRQSGVVPRLHPGRRPPGPPLTDEQKRLITEEWRRAPRGATKLYKALARRGIHIPKMQIYRFGKAQGWVVPNPRKQRRRRSVRYERAHAGSLVHGDFHRTSEANPLRLPFLAKDETTFSRAGQGHGEYENAQPPPGPPDAERLSTCHVPKFAGNRYVNCSQNGSTVGSQWVWPATSNLSFIDKPEA